MLIMVINLWSNFMKNLKLLITSAVITCTFLVPQQIKSMDPEAIDPQQHEHHAGRNIVFEANVPDEQAQRDLAPAANVPDEQAQRDLAPAANVPDEQAQRDLRALLGNLNREYNSVYARLRPLTQNPANPTYQQLYDSTQTAEYIAYRDLLQQVNTQYRLRPEREQGTEYGMQMGTLIRIATDVQPQSRFSELSAKNKRFMRNGVARIASEHSELIARLENMLSPATSDEEGE